MSVFLFLLISCSIHICFKKESHIDASVLLLPTVRCHLSRSLWQTFKHGSSIIYNYIFSSLIPYSDHSSIRHTDYTNELIIMKRMYPTLLTFSISYEIKKSLISVYCRIENYIQHTVKPAHAVTSIKRSFVLKGHIFLALS
jgi:hypothetical protein